MLSMLAEEETFLVRAEVAEWEGEWEEGDFNYLT
jgi:hypothetical protein